VSLYQFSSAGSAEQIVQNFGIAIASTISGIALRILFNQMRRDPVEVEATARLELAEASRRVKRELESAILEFGYFRRTTQQSIGDAMDEVRESMDKVRGLFAGEVERLAAAAGQPLEATSKRSADTLDHLNERTVQILDVSRQLVLEGEQLARSTTNVVKAIDFMLAKLSALQMPTADGKLAPMIQSLTQAVNSLGESTEAQAKNIETNLKHTQNAVVAIAQVLQEMRATETATPTPRARGAERS
jgi:ABC-type transporter Mla subunit MlaD